MIKSDYCAKKDPALSRLEKRLSDLKRVQEQEVRLLKESHKAKRQASVKEIRKLEAFDRKRQWQEFLQEMLPLLLSQVESSFRIAFKGVGDSAVKSDQKIVCLPKLGEVSAELYLWTMHDYTHISKMILQVELHAKTLRKGSPSHYEIFRCEHKVGYSSMKCNADFEAFIQKVNQGQAPPLSALTPITGAARRRR